MIKAIKGNQINIFANITKLSILIIFHQYQIKYKSYSISKSPVATKITEMNVVNIQVLQRGKIADLRVLFTCASGLTSLKSLRLISWKS